MYRIIKKDMLAPRLMNKERLMNAYLSIRPQRGKGGECYRLSKNKTDYEGRSLSYISKLCLDKRGHNRMQQK